MPWAAGTRKELRSGCPGDIPALTMILIEWAVFIEPFLSHHSEPGDAVISVLQMKKLSSK